MTGFPAVAQRLQLDGPRRDAAVWIGALATGAVIVAAIARDAGVAGPAAVPDVIRAAVATVGFFAVCGYAPARVLTPRALAHDWPLLVLPLGAVCGALALTVLGFMFVPFFVSLPVVVVTAITADVLAHRRRPVSRNDSPAASPWLAVLGVAALIAALTLVPTFRTGMATVTGFGADAHAVTGSATVLQHTTPAGIDPALPVDRVPWQWRSKYPIYYALAAISSISGLEPWQAIMTTIAVLLALTAVGIFLLVRRGFGAPAGVAAVAMVVAVLDQMVFHLGVHPYYNQLWGTITLPFSILAGQIWAREPTRRHFWFLALFLIVGLLAYPLMAPFSVGATFLIWLLDRVARKRRGETLEPLRLPRWTRRWWAAVPLFLLCSALAVGVVDKFVGLVKLLGDTKALRSWQGDLFYYPPVNQFFGVARQLPATKLLVAAVVVAGAIGLWRAGSVGRALIPVLAGAAIMAAWFRYLDDGQYLYFKILAFTGPLVLSGTCVALGALPRRLAVVALSALLASCLLLARDEIADNYDQLTPETIQLGEWARALPPGASIRLDTPPDSQLWQTYMLADRPVGSRKPLIYFPHAQFTEGADYVLDETLHPPPPDRAGAAPVRRNATYRLWKLRPDAGPDTTSRTQSNARAPLGSLAR